MPTEAPIRSESSAIRWSGAYNLFLTGVHYAQTVLLARYLAPADFGLVAMVGVLAVLVQGLTGLGLANAVIQRQDITRERLATLYWVNLGGSTILFFLFWLATPLIVSFYREPALAPLVPWIGAGMFVGAIGGHYRALLQKSLDFRRIAVVESVAAMVGLLTAIAGVVSGLGVYALIFAQLARTIVLSLGFLGAGWREWKPLLRVKWQDLEGFISFGLYQMGERVVNQLAANVDYLILGRFFGPGTLGLYQLAYQLVTGPLLVINPVLTQVAVPVFSRKQSDDSALREDFLALTRVLAFAVTPVLVGLAVTAPGFIHVIFGPAWAAAAPLTAILVPVGLLKALGNPTGALYIAKGRPDISFAFNVYVASSNTVAFYLAAQYSAVAVAWSYGAVTLLHFLLGRYLVHRLIGLPPERYFSELARPFATSAAMGAFVAWIARTGGGAVDGAPTLFGAVLVGVVSYAVLAAIFDRASLRQLSALALRRS